jgi:hypothetical protein
MNDETNADELGPIDWIVVGEFPGSRFNGEIAPALRDLVGPYVFRVRSEFASERELFD